ncbi:hypothetical protein K438DRAFT_736814 [Mycena galopus ATCC 62051]|nr:hypothetical protein K438DRAFT_736814 [Mycena galopus ATCC 62051]
MPSTHFKCLGQALKIVIPFTRSSPGPASAKSLPSEAEPNVLRADHSPSPLSSPSSTRGIWESDNETAALDNIPFFFAYGYSNPANALPVPAEPAAVTSMLERSVWSPTPSIIADQELRQRHIHFNDHLIHQQAEERDLRQRRSSPDLCNRLPQDRFQPPQAHHPIPILYSPYIPTVYESLEDEVADHMNKFHDFKRVIDTTVALWATVGRNRGWGVRAEGAC